MRLAAAVFAGVMACNSAAQAEFRCAAEARAGFAEADAAGAVHGPAVALCRALADQLVGKEDAARLILIEPDTGTGMPPADVAFFSADLVTERKLTAALVFGPAVFHDKIGILVPQASPISRPRDVAGRIVCVMTGSSGQAALEDHLAGLSPPPIRLAFRETVEMLDAYNVGRCEAAIGTATELALMRRMTGINNLRSRVLADSVADAPILLALPAQDARMVAKLPTLSLPAAASAP